MFTGSQVLVKSISCDKKKKKKELNVQYSEHNATPPQGLLCPFTARPSEVSCGRQARKLIFNLIEDATGAA